MSASIGYREKRRSWQRTWGSLLAGVVALTIVLILIAWAGHRASTPVNQPSRGSSIDAGTGSAPASQAPAGSPARAHGRQLAQ